MWAVAVAGFHFEFPEEIARFASSTRAMAAFSFDEGHPRLQRGGPSRRFEFVSACLRSGSVIMGLIRSFLWVCRNGHAEMAASSELAFGVGLRCGAPWSH